MREKTLIDPSEITDKDLASVDPWFWAYWNKIKLQSGPFQVAGHEYQIEPMQSTARRRVYKKGAQMGFTEIEVLRTIHGQIYGQYPSGVLYLFPTSDDIAPFSKARFNPLIEDNGGSIKKYVMSTDSVEVKRIGSSMLYLRGARSTQKIEGMKKDASKLRSVPVDKIDFDEIDLMDPDMIFLTLERLSHSMVKEEVYISTPSIPDFGIDKLYQESDQRIWMIKCPHCQRDCCLELDFPGCVKFKDGRPYRSCVRCGGELYPKDGQWVAQFPKQDMVGWWISQLNSIYVDPGDILRLYENPPNGNLQEVYNSKLATAYISSENRLNVNDVYSCCGSHILESKDFGPCAMGVDVGKTLHIVIGKKPKENPGKKKIVWIGEVLNVNDLIELGQRFNVRVGAIDYEPETRMAREFQKNAGFPVYLCDERDKVREGEKTDEKIGVTILARTEICDRTHQATIKGEYILPRRCPQVEEYAKQMSNMAKVLEEDEKRGTKTYRYRKLGLDHFRHATNFFEIACKTLGESSEDPYRDMIHTLVEKKEQDYNPLYFGLGDQYGIFIQ